MQLAWSPGTNGKTIEAEVMVLPDLADSIAFAKWLPSSKRKVHINLHEPTNGQAGL